MRAHWYRGERGRNFGDALTPALFAGLVDVELAWAPPSEAELFAIGSIGHRIPPDFAGIVYGTGLMFDHQSMSLESARVLALRGPLSARASGHSAPLYADPGLLAAGLLKRRRAPRYPLGVVPHYADPDLERRHRHGKIIRVLSGVTNVIGEVAACRAIVTSSLHALILADSLGIPSTWEPSPRVLGDGFKFRDYAASYGQTIQPYTEWLAPQSLVYDKQAQLFDIMRSLR